MKRLLHVPIIASIALVLACLIPLPAAASNNAMSIYAVDLGNDVNGECVIVESDSEILVMDLGNTGAFDNVSEVLERLDAPKPGINSRRKLSLYFSHYHADHTGTLGRDGTLHRILEDYSVSNVYLPSNDIFTGKINGSEYLERHDRIADMVSAMQPNCLVVDLSCGSVFSVGSAEAHVIGPVGVSGFTDPGMEPAENSEQSEQGPWHDFVNNCSLVTKFICGDVVYLTAGDAREEAETALVSAYGAQLKADIFKLSHHALSSNAEDFLSCVRPVYTFGTNNSFNTMRDYGSGDMQVRRTYTVKQRASEYGLCYMLGEEEDGLVVKTDGMTSLCYRYSDQTTPLAGGIVKTVGSYGEDRGGGYYDLYDYYYLDDQGRPISGVKKVSVEGVKGLRMFGSGGLLTTGDWGFLNGKRVYRGWHELAPNAVQYYYQDTAILASGFVAVEGSTYYFPSSNRYCRATGLQKIGKSSYLFTEYGKMVTLRWYNDANGDKNHWLYFGSDGKSLSGWAKIGGDRYYFHPSTSYRACGMTKIGGKYYCFKESGRAYVNVSRKIDGYLCKFDKNGVWTNLPKLIKPTIRKVSSVGGNAMLITWDAQDVSGYEVFLSINKKGGFKKVVTVKKAKTTKCKVGSLKAGKTYYLKVRSYKNIQGYRGVSKYSSAVACKVNASKGKLRAA